jgi:uncharacterized protein YggU (UPF0235/DUF167 family)
VIPLAETPSGVSFRIRVVPRVAGTRGDALLVRLAAAPVEGAANEALIAMLAALLGHARRDISIASGERARDKIVRVAGTNAAEVSEKLLAILPP